MSKQFRSECIECDYFTELNSAAACEFEDGCFYVSVKKEGKQPQVLNKSLNELLNGEGKKQEGPA